MSRHGVLALRLSLGIVYLWFGLLKFFPGLSPAESLASRTTEILSFHMLTGQAAMVFVATLETLIGLGLLTGTAMRLVLALLWFQMVGAISPLVLFPHEVFLKVPFVPTLEGQYIFKNVVLISASLVIGATVRGGRLVAEPGADPDSRS